MKTIGSVLKRLLLALGGSASDNYYNDITLVDRIADLAENGQISPSVIQGGGGISFDDVYPVGSIYMSINSTDPGTLFGGTWVQIEDTFLLAAGQTYTAGDTGGEAEHTLTEAELPAINGTVGVRPWTSGSQLFSPSGAFSIEDGGSAMGSASSGSSNKSKTLTMEFGSGQAHNNMPPYLVVYVWKRTA